VKVLKGAVPDGALFFDERQNVVVVSGNSELQSTVRTLLDGLDAPGRQVMFEVRVADVEPVNDSSNVGVELGGPGFGSGALAQFPYTLTKSSLVVNAQLNALVQHGRASILAQPRVATLNNREASLLVGEQYPVVTVNQQTGYPSVQTIDVGVRLRLTPTIGADGSITADLHPEYSQIIGFNNSFPIVANRKLDATLRVRDGDTIVLGGLFQDVDSDTVTKLPLLGDLPVLGGFFRNRQRSHNRNEVVFYITPHILTADGHEPSPKTP
ncbi:MAG: type II and III secretion system protein, partial [Myxococcota bacterium]|nr:type II and III secretion system protein [Myxococcota bacterium]